MCFKIKNIMFKFIMNSVYQFVFFFIIVYAILYLRYEFKINMDDNTLYIEDNQNTDIRIDNLLTLYENPKIPQNAKNRNFYENKLHRYFYPITLICNLPSNMQTYISIFSPNETPFLYTSIFKIEVFKKTQYSDIDIFKMENDDYLKTYPLYKNAQFTEIPVSGKQIIHIPKGWWIKTDTPQKFSFLVF